jgi:ribonuclease T2
MSDLISVWLRAAPFAALLVASSAHQVATAQSWQCKAPANLPRPAIETPPPGEVRRTPVAGYVLALSWSREFCRGHENDPAMALQCGGKIGEFGFILHGLWPEGRGPDYPQWCRTAGVLSRQVVADNICMTPSVQLLQHQWAKHGICMARKPATYFGAAKLLFDAIEFPDMDRLSRQGQKSGTALNVAGLADAFATYNEGLPASAVKVQTNDRGWLQEVRICLNKKFRPEACPGYAKGAPDKAEVKIWRGS